MTANFQQRMQQAMAAHQAGRLAEAEPVYAEALRQQPRAYPALHLMGLLRYQQGCLEEALDLMQRALAVQPGAPETLMNYAKALDAAGRLGDSLAALDGVVKTNPRHARAWNDRAITLRRMGRSDEALAALEQVLALMPGNAGALLNRANILLDMNRMTEALATYDAVLAADPRNAAALASRGGLRARAKQLEPAIADLEAAMRLSPDVPYLRGNLLHARMTAGDWRDFENEKHALDEAVRAGKHAVEPFAYQALSDSPQDLQTCAQLFARRNFPSASAVYKAAQRRPGPIRIGYVCGEFRQQATMILAAGLFEAHDRERFEIFAFDNGHADDSAMRRRLEAGFAQIIPIAHLPDAAAAQCVADAGIDILVNLNGYFGALRMGLFALRPAPIQVNYLGFPGTLGASCMDYILADACVLPEGDAPYYDEKIVRLPDSYQVNDDKRARPAASAIRSARGLPDTGFVFCNFNFAYKITPDMFVCWMRLLRAVPGSVLWLLHDNDAFAANLRRAATEQGIDAARLIFAPIVPPGDHLARLTLADLVVDSLPYNAHTTASDALWAGVPVLTCRGRAFAGRVGASLLQAANLSELVTETPEAYEALAVSLAHAPERLVALRAHLANCSAPLFDTARITRHIEAAYTEMLARHTRGEAPSDFSI